jgi:hypothetical protein
MTLPFEGSIVDNSNDEPCSDTTCPVLQKPEMPIYYQDGKDFQFFISSYTINSAVRALHFQNALQITQDTNTDKISDNFYDYVKVFGEKKNLKIVYATVGQSNPVIHIDGSGLNLTANIQINFKNPFNDQYNAVTINASIKAKIDLKIETGFMTTGSVKELEMEIDSFKVYFKSSVTLKSIQGMVGTLNLKLKEALNEKLAMGLLIPVPNSFKKEL